MRFIMSAFLALSIIITGGCSSLNRASGTLGGHVDIGPLQPVQRVGEPQPTPSPEMYAAWQIVFLSADGKTEITRADIDSGGDYQIILPVGNYMVTAKPVNGGGLGMQRVESVEIFSRKSTKLDISIDTGIR